MFRLAFRGLMRERARFALSILGVAVAALLMLALSGIYNSYQSRIGGFFGGLPADVWVVQSGTGNFFHSSSIVPADREEQLAALREVESAVPLVMRLVMFETERGDALTNVVGVAEGSVPSGATVVEGASSLGEGDIVLDRALARQTGISTGDTVDLRGLRLEVVGLTTGTDMVMYQYSFASLQDVFRIQGTDEVVNFYLLRMRPGTSTEEAGVAVERAVPGSEAWSSDRVVAENQRVLEDTFLPVIRVILVIGFIVGAAVIGLTTYSTILERRREFGVLKAIGAGRGDLLRLVLAQSAIAATVGTVLGSAAAIALARWAPEVVPQVAVSLRALDFVWIFAAAGGMVLVSIVLPLRRLERLDPAEVFAA